MLALPTTSADSEVVDRLRRRDPRALAELYDRYGRAVYALILRLVRDTALAEDLVQETFLRVWNRVHAFDSVRGSLGPWLLAIARNRAIDYLRSAAGRERNAFEFEETEHPALFTNMESNLLAADKTRRIKEAMEKLAPNLRTVGTITLTDYGFRLPGFDPANPVGDVQGLKQDSHVRRFACY
jgi:RNA polymerase sigma-70 factor, ECF subfamily